MSNPDHNTTFETRNILAPALVGTITGMLLAFNTIATSPHPPKLSDLCYPIVIAPAITCLLLLLHAIINRLSK